MTQSGHERPLLLRCTNLLAGTVNNAENATSCRVDCPGGKGRENEK